MLVHASHFLVFLLFALGLWLRQPEAFRSFARAFLALIYLGLIGYALCPTVPPWMAARGFEVIPPLRHVTAEMYNLTMPRFARSFDVNPIAAMPSLHTAIPVLLVLESIRAHSRRAVTAFLALYALAVITAVTYLGEHYLVDVLAGVALTIAVFLLVHRVIEPRCPEAAPRPLAHTLLYGVLLVCLTIGVARSRTILGQDWVPSEAFVERELAGKTPLADYYRGVHAFARHDWGRALAAFAALPQRLRDDDVLRMEAEARAAVGAR